MDGGGGKIKSFPGLGRGHQGRSGEGQRRTNGGEGGTCLKNTDTFSCFLFVCGGGRGGGTCLNKLLFFCFVFFLGGGGETFLTCH